MPNKPSPEARSLQQLVAHNGRFDVDFYTSAEGHVIRREDVHTPNGNHWKDFWALRDATGALIDWDKYRHDLFSRNGFEVKYIAKINK